jgi:hypothetical protein
VLAGGLGAGMGSCICVLRDSDLMVSTDPSVRLVTGDAGSMPEMGRWLRYQSDPKQIKANSNELALAA